jgi:hypothetical protein
VIYISWYGFQIADIVSSFGGKLSHDEGMSVYDADISHLLEGTSMTGWDDNFMTMCLIDR